MTESLHVLNYSPNPAHRTLALELSDDDARVVFPIAPAWTYWITISLFFLNGIANLASGVFIIRLVWQVGKWPGAAPRNTADVMRHFLLKVGIMTTVGASSWWLAAAHWWWIYRRCGQVPRTLTANKHGLVWRRLKYWRMRERTWSIDKIKSVGFRPVRVAFSGKRTIGNLYIHRGKGLRLRFRLSSPDAQLPGQIAKQLATGLGCPLVTPDHLVGSAGPDGAPLAPSGE